MHFKKDFTLKSLWGVRPWTRHSLVLVVAGFAYIAIGVAYGVAEPSAERERALEVALNWFPLTVWGFIFGVAGVLAIISSRWPTFAETWGYMALTGLSAGWGSAYAFSVIFGDAPMSNITAAMMWLLVAFMWWGISGLVNPDKVVVAVINGPS